VARIDAERLAEERCASTAGEQLTVDQEGLQALINEARKSLEELSEELAKQRESHQTEKLRVQQDHHSKAEELRGKHDEERGALRAKHDQTRDEHLRMVEDARRQLEREREVHSGTMEEDKVRLVDHSRTAGVLEGKVLAMGEENKVLRSRLEDLEHKAHESTVGKQEVTEEQKQLRAQIEEARRESERQRQELERKLKAAAEELEDQEKALDAEEAELENSASGRKQPKCGCAIM